MSGAYGGQNRIVGIVARPSSITEQTRFGHFFSRLPGRLPERRSTLQHAKFHHFLALLKNLSKMRSPISDDGHKCAPVAQLDRVPGYEPGGRGFESYPAHQKFLKNREAAMPHGFLLSAPGVAPASIGAIADCRFLLCLFPSYNERTFWPQSLGCGICLDKYRSHPLRADVQT